jgi:DNA-binding IscR family transcriptional regulator
MTQEIKNLEKPNLKCIMLYLKNNKNNTEKGFTVKELSSNLGIHKENLRGYLHELEKKRLINIIRNKYEMRILI